jgi:DNA ligase-1
MPGVVTADPVVAERLSREALAAGHEGVVVKAIDPPTPPGVAENPG